MLTLHVYISDYSTLRLHIICMYMFVQGNVSCSVRFTLYMYIIVIHYLEFSLPVNLWRLEGGRQSSLRLEGGR